MHTTKPIECITTDSFTLIKDFMHSDTKEFEELPEFEMY